PTTLRPSLPATPGPAAGWLGAEACISPSASSGRPGRPRMLYGNDTTHLEYVLSPYRKPGESFKPEMLLASIDETANTGVDVHLLQPGTGWVPWWKSKVYPADAHYAWWRDTFGLPLCGFAQYMIEGGDILGLFVTRCRARGLSPFVSLRLNDSHGLEFSDATPEALRRYHAEHPEFWWMTQLASRIHRDHPEYRFDPKSAARYHLTWNWAIPQVREHKLALVGELCERYAVDGLELDFMRFPRFFKPDEVPVAERKRLMTAFVTAVRARLDAGPGGSGRRLGVRIPAQLGDYDDLGLDLPALIGSGVDILNLSSFYYTNQQTDLARIRKLVGNAPEIYLEMTHCASHANTPGGAPVTGAIRRATREQLYTTARLAHAQGADGVSLYNFVYYRQDERRLPEAYGEPPFDAIAHLADPAFLDRQPQCYFRGTVQRWGLPSHALPRLAGPGRPLVYELDMATPPGGWRVPGRLRIQADSALSGRRWTARLNGKPLEPSASHDEPYPTPYARPTDGAATMTGWIVPAQQVISGANRLEVTLLEGKSVKLIYLDLAMPTAPLGGG
ncbi:MAG: hypothetical protein M1457_11650, partial [bacterium]|nr:hypothetical protein [bacterium]